ncbi:ATP-dependent Clp protease proteolytic subunit [Clostridiaceae bacterium CLA-AA-H274]|uniref:ATP-dependent Clp protease proteolytic subunit n=1 Tax=Brotaphodocola catenula TaxID=2885361 RepID=A0AAE3DIY5_9FIRM|nr:ATP-dependent Clp protease proteolytic subunit [Brotaphodocola catenula]MCC2163819.1 ATP-dependent Clp protease proteolytic subunit [Brotaphodocola catenula]
MEDELEVKWNEENNGENNGENAENGSGEENSQKRDFQKQELSEQDQNKVNQSQNGSGQSRQNGSQNQGQDQAPEAYGELTLDENSKKRRIQLLSIIGEVEGHENLSGNAKTTKYDYVLPQLAKLEDDDSVEGLLVLLNTSGGDVDAGLAIAEMIASLSMPTVSLVLGGSHSIGVPLAVSTDYSFIVSTGTMMIHPVRMNGLVIGASQTYEYFDMIQDRILSFISEHSRIAYDQAKRLMLNTEMLTRDLGTVLVGTQAVREGLIDEVGGIRDALGKLYEMVDRRRDNLIK